LGRGSGEERGRTFAQQKKKEGEIDSDNEAAKREY